MFRKKIMFVLLSFVFTGGLQAQTDYEKADEAVRQRMIKQVMEANAREKANLKTTVLMFYNGSTGQTVDGKLSYEVKHVDATTLEVRFYEDIKLVKIADFRGFKKIDLNNNVAGVVPVDGVNVISKGNVFLLKSDFPKEVFENGFYMRFVYKD